MDEHAARLGERIARRHRDRFGVRPETLAYAPGRIEVLGNHTDYNEGYVLSAAIDAGACFALSGRADGGVTLLAADLGEEAAFPLARPEADAVTPWANYGKGVAHLLVPAAARARGFNATFGGDIPAGSGLSSSAAVEMATGLALARHYDVRLPPLELARAGQRAEHEFAGARCGLLDQITSLLGRERALVFTDFRSLETDWVDMPGGVLFLVCNTGVRHRLVESAYNERRAACEAAAALFARRLPHPVGALRDVSMEEWQELAPGMEPAAARRSAHVIGENERVLKGMDALRRGDLAAFGHLLFASHESSVNNFENSCAELDALVEQAERTGGVLGARLSGGGFGGSVIALVEEGAAAEAGRALAGAYAARFGHPADVRPVRASAGARLL